MAARRIVMVNTESAFGTLTTSPVLGTDKFYMRLDQDDSFMGDMSPLQQEIMYGGGINIEADTVGTPKETKGSINTLLYPGIQSATFLKWALTATNSGGSVPWTTVPAAIQPVGDLASLAFYHAYVREDGTTYRRELFKGCKCVDGSLEANQGPGASRLWRLKANWTGKLREGNPYDSSSDPTTTPFPNPAETDYPTSPYTFAHLATSTGTVTIGTSGGSNRAATCASVRISWRNVIEVNHYTGEFPSSINCWGRRMEIDLVLRDTASPDDRATWLAMSPITTTIKLDNGTNSLNFAFGANNLYRPWAIQLPNSQRYRQGLKIVNRWSPSGGTDFALTAA